MNNNFIMPEGFIKRIDKEDELHFIESMKQIESREDKIHFAEDIPEIMREDTKGFSMPDGFETLKRKNKVLRIVKE